MKNLLLIMTDHQRFDSLGMVVDGIEVTPNLNRLADEAMTFSKAYNSCPLCVPARTSLATGTYPTKNGVVYNDWAGKTSTDRPTIHAGLMEAGYQVYHVGVDHVKVLPSLEEQIGQDRFIDQKDYKAYAERLGLDMSPYSSHKRLVDEFHEGEWVKKQYSDTTVSEWWSDEGYYKDSFFTEKAILAIEGADSPFALFLNYWAPHPPLVVPKSFMDRFRHCDITLPDNINRTAEGEPESRRKGVPAQLAEGVSMGDWKEVWRAHLALLSYVDSLIGDVIKALKSKGIYDTTTIVFTSDHGDHLGQHGMYQKMEMYEEAVHVPLLIKDSQLGRGTIDGMVSHLDLFPTLMSLLGFNGPKDLDGIDLTEAISKQDILEGRLIYGQYSGNPSLGTIRRAVMSRGYKYVTDGDGGEELFDLREDPGEMQNVAGDRAYEDLLTAFRSHRKDWAAMKGDWIL